MDDCISELEKKLDDLIANVPIRRMPMFDTVYGYNTEKDYGQRAFEYPFYTNLEKGHAVWIIDFSTMPTGTFKDIRTLELILNQLKRAKCKHDNTNVVVATFTSGNSGASAEYWVRYINTMLGREQLHAVSFVAGKVPEHLGQQKNCYVISIRDAETRIVEPSEIIERATSYVRERLDDRAQDLPTLYLEESGIDETKFGYVLRSSIYKIVTRAIKTVPPIVRNEYDYDKREKKQVTNFGQVTFFVPVGNGELFCAINSTVKWYYDLFRFRDRYEGENRFVDMNTIGVTIAENPFGRAIINKESEDRLRGSMLKREENWMPYVDFRIDDTQFLESRGSIADKLCCPWTMYLKNQLYLTAGGLIYRNQRPPFLVVSEDEIKREMEEWQAHGINAEPSACVAGAGARLMRTLPPLTGLTRDEFGRFPLIRPSYKPPYNYEPVYNNIVIVNTGKGVQSK